MARRIELVVEYDATDLIGVGFDLLRDHGESERVQKSKADVGILHSMLCLWLDQLRTGHVKQNLGIQVIPKKHISLQPGSV